ncbi:MAG: ClpXP protease specificity-enhancing factor [Gammaproteobacteria bacterium CG_4_10_14_0_8_um_filter_38_16]|nr:MAG: ClpXP protease specificity-enhancing factor [Gammaproteobacteria bacterium CG_4_10_14_0_8_um_filter_38_16]PJA03822.1 MAG: ClpXP protease specificity-enhancing factor [Gammaproteobacteria bacterium CG_4_10_14_0_2_um_filter_38_22]PJB10796.1 MAG: ClpXP protease specificity-enhancing factor [Gammaproteobacteria bacterium CG_4_9_14_3_um_filter_38_9]
MTPSRPYFLRALNEWIVANALTPHLLVDVEQPGVNVPQQYVKDGRIVLNIAPQAVNNLSMANDWVSFDARFSGVLHRIRLPIMSILGIYAVENGRGMMFDHEESDDDIPPDHEPPTHSKDPRPSLKVVK